MCFPKCSCGISVVQNSNTFLSSVVVVRDTACAQYPRTASAGCAPLFSKYIPAVSTDAYSSVLKILTFWHLKDAYFLASFGLLAPYLERACFLFATPAVSNTPLTMWYLVPGRSFTLPPRIKTTLCSCRLWPSPGI